jgi:hypothetical protein
MVETGFGFHIMFMSEVGTPYWKGLASEIKSETEFHAARMAILERFALEVMDFDRSFVDTLVEPVDENAMG